MQDMKAMEQALSGQAAPQKLPEQTPQLPQDKSTQVAPWMADNDQEDDVEGAVIANMDDLSEEDKQFVDNYLSDELAMVIAKIGGDDRIYEALKQYVNPEIMLVPVPRQEFIGMMNSPDNSSMPTSTPEATQPAQPEAAPSSINQ